MSDRKALETVERCETCRFWRDSYKKLANGSEGTVGWCRRYPPQLSPDWVSETYEAADVYSAASNPGTEWRDWCGEYQPTLAPPPSAG